jgi:hypothetical protein
VLKRKTTNNLLISLGDDGIGIPCADFTSLPVRAAAFHRLNFPINGNPTGIYQTYSGFFFVLFVNVSGVMKYTGSFHGNGSFDFYLM